jgi:hypothetical protein
MSRVRLDRAQKKTGGRGDVEAQRDVMRRGVWLARGEEGPGWGTNPGAADAGNAPCGNRGGAGAATWAAVGELLGCMLWARPSEQCLF